MKTIFLITGLLRNYEYKYRNFLSKISHINSAIYAVTWDLEDVNYNQIFKVFNTPNIKIHKYNKYLINNQGKINKFNQALKINLPKGYKIQYYENMFHRFYLFNEGLKMIENNEDLDNIFIVLLRFDLEIDNIDINYLNNKNFIVNNISDLNSNPFLDYIYSGVYNQMRYYRNFIDFILNDWYKLNNNNKLYTEDIITVFLKNLEKKKLILIDIKCYFKYYCKRNRHYIDLYRFILPS